MLNKSGFSFRKAALSACMAFSAAMAAMTVPQAASASDNLSLDEARSTSTFPELREVVQEGLNPHVDLSMGLTSPEGSYASGVEYGLGFGFQPYVPFGLGVAMTYSSNNSKFSDTRSLERTTVLVRGTYHFAGDIPIVRYSHVGIAAGPVINQDATYLGLTPLVGFDIPVREWVGEYVSYVSVGVEAKYLMVSSDESDGLTVNGALKYWF